MVLSLRIRDRNAGRKTARRSAGRLQQARHGVVREQWPPDYPKPSVSCVWQNLERAVNAGLIVRSGTGRRTEPYRYWLPSREKELCRDDEFRLDDLGPMDQRTVLNLAATVLRVKGKRVDG